VRRFFCETRPRRPDCERVPKFRAHIRPSAVRVKWTELFPSVSVIDAVDGSSTRHVSAMDVGAVKAPTIRRS
jgi:hypothetical protein